MLNRWAIGLSFAYVADGIFMAWAMVMGSYAGAAYWLLSFFPILVPACLLGLVACRLYWQGVTRQGWKLRTVEKLFVSLLFNAVAVKVILSIYNWLR